MSQAEIDLALDIGRASVLLLGIIAGAVIASSFKGRWFVWFVLFGCFAGSASAGDVWAIQRFKNTGSATLWYNSTWEPMPGGFPSGDGLGPAASLAPNESSLFAHGNNEPNHRRWAGTCIFWVESGGVYTRVWTLNYAYQYDIQDSVYNVVNISISAPPVGNPSYFVPTNFPFTGSNIPGVIWEAEGHYEYDNGMWVFSNNYKDPDWTPPAFNDGNRWYFGMRPGGNIIPPVDAMEWYAVLAGPNAPVLPPLVDFPPYSGEIDWDSENPTLSDLGAIRADYWGDMAYWQNKEQNEYLDGILAALNGLGSAVDGVKSAVEASGGVGGGGGSTSPPPSGIAFDYERLFEHLDKGTDAITGAVISAVAVMTATNGATSIDWSTNDFVDAEDPGGDRPTLYDQGSNFMAQASNRKIVSDVLFNKIVIFPVNIEHRSLWYSNSIVIPLVGSVPIYIDAGKYPQLVSARAWGVKALTIVFIFAVFRIFTKAITT
jgi:hypothetical protein